MASVGGSVAKANAAIVSMIRLIWSSSVLVSKDFHDYLTQSNCTAFRTGSILSLYMDVTKDKMTAVMLTVIWNCELSVT